MPTIRERIKANRRARGLADEDSFRMDQAALAGTRDELRKMQLLHANPELEKRLLAQKAALKAKEDAALAEYMVAHPDVAEKLITSELMKASRKTSRIERSLGHAAYTASFGTPNMGSADLTEKAMLMNQIRAMKGVLESLGINPDLYSSPLINRARGRVGDLDAIVDAARAAASAAQPPPGVAPPLMLVPATGVTTRPSGVATRSTGVPLVASKAGSSPYKDALQARAAAAGPGSTAAAAAAAAPGTPGAFGILHRT